MPSNSMHRRACIKSEACVVLHTPVPFGAAVEFFDFSPFHSLRSALQSNDIEYMHLSKCTFFFTSKMYNLHPRTLLHSYRFATSEM